MVWTKRKLPTEDAPGFNPDDPYADPVALLEHREHVVWEKEVRVEEAKILREKLKDCYLREGVNHYQNCRQLVDKYLDSIKGVGVYRANAHRYSDNPPQVKGIPSSDAK